MATAPQIPLDSNRNVRPGEAPPSHAPGVAAQLGEIINDAQMLIRQELALARTEMQSSWLEARKAYTVLVVGGVLGSLGTLLLSHAIALFLVNLTGVALWLCYAIVSVVFLVAGTVLVWRGRWATKKVSFVPQGTLQNVKENVQWIRNRT